VVVPLQQQASKPLVGLKSTCWEAFFFVITGANNSIPNVENSNADWYVLILPYSPLVFNVSFAKAYFAFESEGLYSKESHCYAAHANRKSNF